MMSKHLFSWFGLVTVAALLLAACAPGTESPPEETSVPTQGLAETTGAGPTATVEQVETAAEPVVLRVGVTFEPDTFHPFAGATFWRFGDLIYEGFVGWGESCQPSPRMAQSMEMSDDGLTWTITLRPGITYTDGQPLDAYVLKEYWDWIMTTELADWFPPTRYSESWDAVDELTFRFTTSVPIGTWASYDAVWQWPLAPQIWGQTTDDTVWDVDADSNPIGTGPYSLTEWQRGDHLVYDARPDYYLGKPPIDRIVHQVYGNWDAIVLALQGGEIDLTEGNVPAQYYESLANQPNITVIEEPPAYYYQLVFNMKDGGTKHPAIDDASVREAIDYAIDKENIVELALEGHGVTCPTNWNCGPLFEWSFDPSLVVTPYDPEMANSILDEAGYIDNDGDGVRETPDGRPMDFRFFIRADRPSEVTMAELIGDWLSEIGISINIEAMELNTLTSAMREDRDFDMAINFWAGDPDPAVMDFELSCWSAESGGINHSGFCTPELDDLIYQQFTAPDLETRLSRLYQLEDLVNRERPFIMLAGENAIQAYRNDRFVFPEKPCSFWGMDWQWWPVMRAEPVE